jgi:TolB protein
MNKPKHLPTLILFTILAAFLLAACASPREPHQIAFESYRDGNAEVYVIDDDGKNLVRLTEDPAYDGVPNWTPDGQNLAFTSERTGNPDIYVMAADGSNVVQLTEGVESFSVVPVWSPDGSQIMFVSNRTYNVQGDGGHFEIPANPKLWVMQADGSSPERLTSRIGFDIFPSWAPDGKSVVFMSVRDGNAEIYLKRTDQPEENITNHPARDANPAFSPDGTKIAFMSDRDGDMDIYIMDIESGSLTNITNHPAADGDPAWSPDGTQLAFISDRDGNVEIYIMDEDGSNVRRITNDPADDIMPQWRPSQGSQP